MKYQKCFFFFLIFSSLILAQSTKLKMEKQYSFSKAFVHFEQNATDGDVEAVFEIQGDDDGLDKLTVISPNGNKIIDFNAPLKSTMGIRQFRFESPEPSNIKSLKAAYPEGEYTFEGRTSKGRLLAGKYRLSHKLPKGTSFIFPKPGSKNVDPKKLKIEWTGVKNIDSYIVYIEEGDFNFTITLPGSKNELSIPPGILKSSTKYTLGIGTVSKEGNSTFVETSFTTGSGK